MATLKELEPELWSELEFGPCELGDLRRTRRLVRYARQMAERPDASTPQQTEDWAECKAAYRLFDCPEVTFEAVTAAHYERTLTAVVSRQVSRDQRYDGIGLRVQKPAGRTRATGGQASSRLFPALGTGGRCPHPPSDGLGRSGNSARLPGKVTRVRRVACRKRPTESDVWGRVMDRVPCRGPGCSWCMCATAGPTTSMCLLISRPRAIVGSFARLS